MTILFIGGFASNPAQLRTLQSELEEYFSVPVRAYSLRYALTHADEIIESGKEVTVITHSAGVLATLKIRPKSLWIIAPPRTVTRRRDLLSRSARKTMDLWRGSLKSKPRLVRVAKYHLHATPEVLFNLAFYIKFLRRVSLFDLTAFIEGRLRDMEVRVVHMTKDSLYNQTVDESELMVEGEHDEILLYPARVVRAAKIRVVSE